jgi:hypothetical protein
VSQYATERPKIKYSRNSIIRQVRDRVGDELRKLTNREVQKKITEKHFEVHNVLWRTINLGRPVIELTLKCEAGIMFN